MLALDRPLDRLQAELPAQLAAELAELVDYAQRYAAAAQAINTTRAYATDWQFTSWCGRYQLESLPAAAPVIALYLTSLAERGLAVSTIRRRAAAIARAHRQAGHLPATSDPSVLTVMEGITRVHGAAPNKKTALLRDPLLELIDRIDTGTNAGLRDRALLLLGFAVGLRRSELVALTVEDLPLSRRPANPSSALQDRPARPRSRTAARLRRTAAALPGSGAARVARRLRHQQRADLPARHPHWSRLQPPHGANSRAGHQEARSRREPRPAGVRWPLTPLGLRHAGGRDGHHATQIAATTTNASWPAASAPDAAATTSPTCSEH